MNREKEGTYIVLINFAILILLGYFIYKYSSFYVPLFSVGGSLMLVAIMGVLILLTYIAKPLALELSSTTVIITGILIFNFLSYLEISGISINITYLIIFYICLYCFIGIELIILRMPFKNYNQVSDSERSFFIKNIMLNLLLPILVFGLIFATLSSLMVHFIRTHDPNITVSFPFLTISYMGVAWLVIASLITFIYLSKIPDKDLRKYFKEEKLDIVKYDIRKIKKYSVMILFIVIFFGSIAEIQRGMWVMWIETVLLLVLMSLIFWKIYKHVFSTKA